jgi:DNA adenine methylase
LRPNDFQEDDFGDLVDILKSIKGKFLLTINDTPEVRELFGCFQVKEVELKYSVTRSLKGRGKKRTELLISN